MEITKESQHKILDPLEIDAPIGRQPIHFRSSTDPKPEWMTKLHDQIITASGFLMVCPEYNATIAPALTNLLNYFPPNSYRHKPVSLITYSMGKKIDKFGFQSTYFKYIFVGKYGGIRARQELISFSVELGMVNLKYNFDFPKFRLKCVL